MAKKSNVPSGEITKRMARIKYAERVRNEYDIRYGYSDALSLYDGDFKSALPSWMSGLDIIPINEVYAYTKTFVPTVYSRDPYITISPKGRAHIIGAKILELAVNAFWRELRLKHQIRRAIFDALFAEGWIKLGYSAALGKIERPEGEKALFPHEYIAGEEIFGQRISWRNMVRDPDAIDGTRDARFLAHQIILPLSAVKNNSLFENTEELQPNYSKEVSSAIPGIRSSGPVYTTEEEYVVLWEEWNQDEEKVCVLAEGHDKYLMYKKWPYRFNGYPFELLRFNESDDKPYAPNSITPWLPQLWEKIKIRSMELDHIKRFGRQLAAEKGSLTRLEMDKFKKGITGSIIQYENGKQPPTPIQYPPIQTDIYAIENRIDVDKDNISGQPNVVRSAPQKTQSRTLGELDKLITAFQSRQSDPQSAVEDFSEEIAKKIIGLMQQYFKEPRFIRATKIDSDWLAREAKDTPTASTFERGGFLMDSKDIKNLNFDLEVRAGSTLPLDKKNRIQSMISIIELGERIGIMPGDKVSRVVGKNLINDFDMPEIIAAYEEVLKKMEAAEKVAMVAAITKPEMIRQQAMRVAKDREADMAAGVPAGGSPGIPPEMLQ